jgi:multidrug efflux pump subunit AcrB
MNFLSQFFLKNYKFTLVMTFFVLVYGLTGLVGIKSESFPSVNIGAVVITTRYDGATADDIETKITKPIEEEIQKVSGLKKVSSTSQAGFSTIVTEVDIDKYDTVKVIADLQRAVDRASGLPPDLESKPIFFEVKSDEFPVIELAVVGSNENRLRDQAADNLKEDLSDNKKISTISFQGFRERQFNIFLDRQVLERMHVSITEVQAALQLRNVNVPGGEIKGGSEQKLIRIEGKAKSADDLKNIVVRSNFSGQQILLGQIAEIEDSEAEATTLTRHNGEPSTVLTITKKGGADLLQLVDEINSVLEIYNAKYDGQLKFLVFNNEGVRVSNRLDVLISNGWQGLVLVVIILMIFIPGRIGLMTSLSLPLALFLTLGLVYSMGYTLNTITIIGLIIALGMLVDNSVVISENFIRLKKDGADTDEALLKTIQELWAPVTATALCVIAAFAPMLVTSGVMGQFIKAIPIVVSLALILSLAESFFLLPTRLKLLKLDTPKNAKTLDQPDWLDRVVVPAFQRQMVWVVDNKWKSSGIFSLVLIGSMLLMIFGVKLNLFPAEQTEIYIGRLQTPKGTRIETTDQVTAEVSKQIKDQFKDQVIHIVQTSGESATDASDVKGEVGSNTAMVKIFVAKETQDNVSTNEVLAQLRQIKNERVSQISFEALVNGPPVGDPVTLTFRSNDMEQLSQATLHIKSVLEKTNGLFDVRIDDVFGDDEVFVNVDYQKAARLGLSLQDIGFAVRTAIAGQKTGDVNLNNREVDYFLRFKDSDKQSLEQLNKLTISDQRGNLIPLSNVATFKVESGTPQIKRYDYRRAKTITANLDDTIITSIEANKIAAQEFEKIQSQFKDVNLVFAGEAEKTNESMASLFNALILSVIGIFALLVLVFRSFSSPFIILTTIPFGLVGIAVAFSLQGKSLSFMALIGIVGVGGIIVNAGIILIAFIEQLRTEGRLPLHEILVQSSAKRLRAVIVTSVTNVIGLIPTAYGIGGSDYFIIPMTLSIAWGLTTGTILTLYWIPPAYAIVEELKAKLRALKLKPTRMVLSQQKGNVDAT